MVEPGGSDNPHGSRQQLGLYFTEWSAYHVQQPLPTGLPNISTVCYRNSVLHMLLHTPVLVNWLWLHCEHPERGPTTPALDACLPCFLRVFFEEHWLHRESHLALWNHLHCLSSSINSVGWESTSQSDQEDAVEYLTHILNTLKQQAMLTDESDAIEYMFQIELEYRATCGLCGSIKSYPAEREFFLRAAINNNGRSNVKDAIDEYLANAESIVSWTCESCSMDNNAPRRCVIRDAPEVLLVQINRFTSKNPGGKPVKLTTAVEFQETLNIRDFESYSGQNPDDGVEYQLFAAIYHVGERISGGHYYIYARGPTGNWSKVNDEDVTKAEFSEVVDAQNVRDCVYVLAYRRTTASERIAPTAATQQPQNDQVIPQDEALAPSDERSVDIRTAEVSIDDRSLIGGLQGWLTLPGTQPLVMLQPRKRVMQATLDIDLSMGSSKLVGTLRGNLKPMQGAALNSHPQPLATAPPESIPAQSAPPQSTLPQTAVVPNAMGPGAPVAHASVPQDPVPPELGAQKTDSKSQSGKLAKPKPAPPTKAPSKRKRDQAEEKQEPEGIGERAPKTKRQKPGPKPKADKSDKSKSKKKADSKKKEGDGISKGQSKAGKLRKKEKVEKEASTGAVAGADPVAPAGGVDEPSKPRPKLKLKFKGPQTGSSGPTAAPAEHPNEDTQEVRQYQEGAIQHSQGEQPEDDIVQPPPQPPSQPPARAKSQRPPKPPPREGTRKNPRRAGKKETD